MKAWLVRHTAVEGVTGRCYGQLDVSLAASFPTEIVTVRQRLPADVRLAWSSPAKRCRQLAQALGFAEVRLEPRLAELAMGDWEGRRWEDLCGAEWEAWLADPWHARPPGGETADELLARVARFREELLAATGGPAVVFTHAGVIRAWRSLAEGRPLAHLFDEKIEPGSIWPAA